MTRRQWFEVHSWLGVITGLMLFFICWSGTVAVFSDELDWLLDARVRAAPAPQGVDWDRLEDTINAAYPDALNFSLHAPPAAGFAAHAVVDTPQQAMMRVYLDPASGEVLGESSYFNVQRFFRSLHMSLFDLGSGRLWGYWVVCSFSILLLVSALTPLVFYARLWRGFYTLKFNRGARAFWSDLHKFAGLWSLLFTLLIAITGLWYLVELGGADFGYPPTPSVSVEPQPGPRITLAEAVASAHAAWPALDVTGITPEKGSFWGNVVRLEGQAEALLVRDRANFMMLDPATGDVLAMQKAIDLPWPTRWVDTSDPLHFGNFAGLGIKLLWFVFGLMLSSLCLTGAYLHVKRLASRGISERYRWRGTLFAVGLTAALLVVASWGGWKELLSYGPLVNGAATLPQLPLPVTLFLAAWTFVTLAIMAVWAWYVLRPPRGSGQPAASRTAHGKVARAS